MDHQMFTGMLDTLWRQEVGGLLGLIFVIMALQLVVGKRRKWRPKESAASKPFRDMADPAQQMNAVAEAGFKRRAVMNKTEYRVFQVIEQHLRRHGGGYRLMAQTSLGEVLSPDVGSNSQLQRQALASINSKRLDMAIFDRSGMLTLAIEVQGGGHYQHRKTFMRDAVKREALRRAGVDMLEVTPDFNAEHLCQSVTRYLHPEANRMAS